MTKDYSDIRRDKQYVDIPCARFVLQPERFDVMVGSNLFNDILSDLGPACVSTIGIMPSASLDPERTSPSLFESVYGPAPGVYGKNITNPITIVWAGMMMLDLLGSGGARYHATHDSILATIEQVAASGLKIPDMRGSTSIQQVSDAIYKAVLA